MKKIILLFFISFSIINAKGQEFTSFFIGVNNARINTLDASPFGFVMGFDYNKLHVDFSSNYAKGEGEYLEYLSNNINQENKRMWNIVNVGINIPIKQTNNNSLIFTHKMGYCNVYSLYTDYKKFYEEKYNMGVHLSYLNKDTMFSMGTSLIERFYFSIGVLF